MNISHFQATASSLTLGQVPESEDGDENDSSDARSFEPLSRDRRADNAKRRKRRLSSVPDETSANAEEGRRIADASVNLRPRKRKLRNNLAKGDGSSRDSDPVAQSKRSLLTENRIKDLGVPEFQDLGKPQTKSRRKRPTGRPSGLNLAPALVSDDGRLSKTESDSRGQKDVSLHQATEPRHEETVHKKQQVTEPREGQRRPSASSSIASEDGNDHTDDSDKQDKNAGSLESVRQEAQRRVTRSKKRKAESGPTDQISAPRKRVQGLFGGKVDDDDYGPVAQSDSNSSHDAQSRDNRSKAKVNVSSESKSSRLLSSGHIERKGPFSHMEKILIQAAFAQVVEREGFSEQGLRAAIQDWKSEKLSMFKFQIETAVPKRSRASLRKYCQRAYHTYNRGNWTEEEDEKLKRAHAAHPDQWAGIADLVGRHGDDCKDRWRNVLRWDHVFQGPWAADEEEALMDVVQNFKALIKEQNKHDSALLRDEEKMEQLINWNAVSEKLRYTRKIKSCREKYRSLMIRRELEKQQANTTQAMTWSETAQPSKKWRRAASQYSSFDIGDKYDALVEIHTAIADHSKVFTPESSLWSQVAVQNKGSRFSSALRRHAFHDAALQYKDRLGDKTTIAAAAAALARIMEEDHGPTTLAEGRSFKIDLPNGSNAGVNMIAAATKSVAPSFDMREGVEHQKVSARVEGEGDERNPDPRPQHSQPAPKAHGETSPGSKSESIVSSFFPDGDYTSTDSEGLTTPRMSRAQFAAKIRKAGQTQHAHLMARVDGRGRHARA